MVSMQSIVATTCLLAATALAENNTWIMKPVHTIQARVQAFAPVFDNGPGHNTFVADFVPTAVTFQDRYTVSMDTINTASVEGALMYLQAEGIDYAVNRPCYRKNNMSYIWFYNITIVQPTFMLAEFQDTQMPEYGPFVAMDNGICTPISAQVPVPAECQEFDGLNNYPKLGPFIGGEPRNADPRAPYDQNIWFSFPNSCYLKAFGAKTAECRKAQTGGMCPRGKQPDGITCTYSFEVMGYLAIDELVGITAMQNSQGKNYSGFVEFCKDNKTEFDTRNLNMSIPFWMDPYNHTANQERSKTMMDLYNINAKKSGSNMIPLPEVKDLTAINPPCYLNSKRCYDAPNGCRRKLLAQVCEVCTDSSADCVKKPANAAPFPSLIKAEKKVPAAALVTNTTGAFGKNSSQGFVPGKPQTTASGSGAPSGSQGSAAVSTMASVGVVVAAALALML
ncbi:unnamed protein product [Aphanomyces euteiches]|nr:hypothetical protein AeRB84_013296 [Aphanomyces euteiches]